ncbi:uncharacterized protein EI90DRAFT_3042271, partial [Cantharellus anzutake]|uniref:uncharacterized protein n=1 Tax=Cantharellus anzutake TaxID=1750568 RepID=UPI001902D79D
MGLVALAMFSPYFCVGSCEGIQAHVASCCPQIFLVFSCSLNTEIYGILVQNYSRATRQSPRYCHPSWLQWVVSSRLF